MNTLKYFCISVDGIPYSGKSTICQYLRRYSKKYMILDDGIIKSITTARCLGNIQPNFSQFAQTVVIYLLVAKDDWNARCQNTTIQANYDNISAELNKTAQLLDDAGIKILVYNTSKYSPYLIAKDILHQLDNINNTDTCNINENLSADTSQDSSNLSVAN